MIHCLKLTQSKAGIPKTTLPQISVMLYCDCAKYGYRLDFTYFHHLFGKGNGNPLQYSCLENPMDKGAWCATVHGVAKSWT